MTSSLGRGRCVSASFLLGHLFRGTPAATRRGAFPGPRPRLLFAIFTLACFLMPAFSKNFLFQLRMAHAPRFHAF